MRVQSVISGLAAALLFQSALADDPWGSRYEAGNAAGFAITGATILLGNGERLDDADLLVVDGRIEAVGSGLTIPDGIERIAADGRWVTPGLIDVHSHLGVFGTPGYVAHADGNEMSGPNTANVWAEHGIWPQDPGFVTALAGGVTTLHILPGSANLFGGRSVTVKNVPARSAAEMKFPGAPHGLKMACGENPKRVYGQGRNAAPVTRMGNVALKREAWISAARYRDRLAAANDGNGDPPDRDLGLETLAAVLDGEVLIQNHCYRADEMAIMLQMAEEFDFHITAFHHATEAYKIGDLLAETGTCAAMWADWWGFKLEAWDTVRENVAMVDAAGACAVLHSDSADDIQRLNQEVAKTMAAANRAGLDVTPERAITWLTANAARMLGIADETGTLEPGKAADVVLWDGDPFSVYTRTVKVWIDGVKRLDRGDPVLPPDGDFFHGTRDGVRP